MKRISNTNEFLALKLGTDVNGSPTNLKTKGKSPNPFSSEVSIQMSHYFLIYRCMMIHSIMVFQIGRILQTVIGR